MIAAGGLDYSVNVVAGRWLEPVDFGVFVSVTAILQVFIMLSIAIRMVVAVHTAELAAQDGHRVGTFVRRVWRMVWEVGRHGDRGRRTGQPFPRALAPAF